MNERHFYCSVENESSLVYLEGMVKRVEGRFRFWMVTVHFSPTKVSNYYDICVRTIAEGETLQGLLEYMAGFLDCFEEIREISED